MSTTTQQNSNAAVSFQVHPDSYKHWRLNVDGDIARLSMDVDPDGGIRPGYELKLNSYDLGVDIELADAVQRIRFEHPQVRCIIFDSSNEKVFCAGANITMLRSSAHNWKVNFCKFTNETRLYLEDASEFSGIKSLAACAGATAGGGYELALACDEILLVDDSNSTVSLPEVPLLAVLPGTGGLTRVVDKRMVRRDRADVFSSLAEGMKGKKAIDWNLIDATAPSSKFAAKTNEMARNLANSVDDKSSRQGVELKAVNCDSSPGLLKYSMVEFSYSDTTRCGELTLRLPESAGSANVDDIFGQGSEWWMFKMFREVDDALVQMRVNMTGINMVSVRVVGNVQVALDADEILMANQNHWFCDEVQLFIKRVLKRYDMTAKSFFALADEGSAFAGTWLEFALGADRFYVLDDADVEVKLGVSMANAGPYLMGNGLTRLETRFLADPQMAESVLNANGVIDAADAESLGLATEALDEIDWEDEIRVYIEERASYSPDALTGMEANLRFAGPETLETKIFGRLTAWQNWIFQRPNAVGETGALQCYGTPSRPQFDYNRT
ncbi:MAG: benzoyl-CoA-dihydrodiol lyase [Planctomycetes bacterium]|nr:benzoyl-CoA-dihydrodiol lyase [Planctomycetota bacterium]